MILLVAPVSLLMAVSALTLLEPLQRLAGESSAVMGSQGGSYDVNYPGRKTDPFFRCPNIRRNCTFD